LALFFLGEFCQSFALDFRLFTAKSLDSAGLRTYDPAAFLGCFLRSLTEHTMKTFSAKPAEVRRDWFVIDATDKTLGRMATEIARRLRGKHKPEYTPHVDTGDYIVVVNAEKVQVTGNKPKDKMYHRHTGYPGGLKSMPFEKMIQSHPERLIELTVKGMLPKNPLGRAMLKKLKVFAGPQHNHSAQQPRTLEI
jgi:large subunit ribosomal protein L13